MQTFKCKYAEYEWRWSCNSGWTWALSLLVAVVEPILPPAAELSPRFRCAFSHGSSFLSLDEPLLSQAWGRSTESEAMLPEITDWDSIIKRDKVAYIIECVGQLFWNAEHVWAVGGEEGPSQSPRQGAFILRPCLTLHVWICDGSRHQSHRPFSFSLLSQHELYIRAYHMLSDFPPVSIPDSNRRCNNQSSTD